MKYVKIVLTLTLVAVFSGGILSLADIYSRDRIAQNKIEALNSGIRMIESEASNIEELYEGVYKLLNESGDFIGYAVAASGQGYQGKITLIYGIDADLEKISGIEVIESSETPGLGSRINDNDYKDQFKNLGVTYNIECVKGEVNTVNTNATTATTEMVSSKISVITGATVSSKAVVAIINKSIKKLREKLD